MVFLVKYVIFAAFPGQIVGVLGRSGMSGSTFHARDFVASLPSPLAVPRPDAQLHLMVGKLSRNLARIDFGLNLSFMVFTIYFSDLWTVSTM